MLKLFVLPIVIFISVAVSPAASQGIDLSGLPAFSSQQTENGDVQYSLSLQILALMTAVTLLPSLVLGMTSFTRIIIVLSILRQALGTQQTPPNQVLIAIAIFLSFFIMQPTLTEIYDVSLSPFLSETLPADQAIIEASSIMKDFMVANTRSDTLLMFSDMAGSKGYENNEDIPFSTLLPSFITSELKTAFKI
jgi:flagellar biosynthetic protein FliP